MTRERCGQSDQTLFSLSVLASCIVVWSVTNKCNDVSPTAVICCSFFKSGYCPHKLIAGHCFDNSPYMAVREWYRRCICQLQTTAAPYMAGRKVETTFHTHRLTGLIKYMGSRVIHRINAFVSCKPNHHTGSKVETTVSTHGLALDPNGPLSVAHQTTTQAHYL